MALGVGTNLLLAIRGGNLGWLVVAIILSGVYIAVEETLEKAVLASWLPKERRSLGLGYLACFNAVGDMVSSLYVGWLLEAGRPGLAFGIAASVGAVGVVWLAVMSLRLNLRQGRAQAG
jgi:MFS family permease